MRAKSLFCELFYLQHLLPPSMEHRRWLTFTDRMDELPWYPNKCVQPKTIGRCHYSSNRWPKFSFCFSWKTKQCWQSTEGEDFRCDFYFGNNLAGGVREKEREKIGREKERWRISKFIYSNSLILQMMMSLIYSSGTKSFPSELSNGRDRPEQVIGRSAVCYVKG